MGTYVAVQVYSSTVLLALYMAMIFDMAGYNSLISGVYKDLY